MTRCPGYFDLSISPWPTVTSPVVVLAHYDVIVTCPAEFNLDISLPTSANHHQPHPPSSNSADGFEECYLIITLDDQSATTSGRFLVRLDSSSPEVSFSSPPTSGSGPETKSERRRASQKETGSRNGIREADDEKEDRDMIVLAISGAFVVSLTLTSLVGFVQMSGRRSLIVSKGCHRTCCRRLRRPASRSPWLRVAVVTVRLALSVSFTFTAAFGLAEVLLRSRVERLVDEFDVRRPRGCQQDTGAGADTRVPGGTTTTTTTMRFIDPPLDYFTDDDDNEKMEVVRFNLRFRK